MRYIIEMSPILLWLAGTVLAYGFWSTFFAILFPPWAWYLVVERLMAVTWFIGGC